MNRSLEKEKDTFWKRLQKSVRPFDQPKHYAVAVALGMLVGLIPKFSVLPFIFGIIALLSSANLGMFIVSTIVFSWMGPTLDPTTHRIGKWLLTEPSLESFWTTLAQLPLSIWLQFHNTVVTGSLMLALAMLVPVYVSARLMTAWMKPFVERVLLRNVIANWLRGYPLAT